MARNFNGTTDLITVPHGTGLDNLQTWTAWGWLRYSTLNGAANQYAMSKNGTDRVYLQFGNIAAGTAALGANVGRATTASSYRSPSSAIAANTWTFAAINFDDSRGAGARFQMFIGTTPSNLASVAVTAFTEGTGAINDDTAAALAIGGRTTDQARSWSGDIGKTGLTSAILTLADLQAIMEDSLPTGGSAPAAYWLLAETGSPTTAADATGNGHTGTYSGTTAASSDPPTFSSNPTTATLSGPASGPIGVASSNFTVTLNLAADQTYTVTPSDSSGGGTFTPSSPTIATSATTCTFTYTPGSAGAKSISIATSPALTPAGSPITYTATAATLTCGPTCSVSDTTARVSFRASGDTAVSVKYSTATDLSGSTTTGTVSVTSSADWTGKIDLSGLAANTTYSYTILLGGVDQFSAPYPTLKTFPAAGSAASFSFAFGSCAAHTAAHAPAGDTIYAALPGTTRFLLHLGDTIYADQDVISGGDDTTLAGFRAFHREAMAGGDTYSSGWAAWRKKAPVFAIWDDHDLVDNFDAGTGAARYAPAKQAFQEYHARANPDSMTAGELYYSFACGNVGFFVLDGRSFRSAGANTDDGSKVMLGATQLAALRSWLSANNSTYRIKFICSGTSASGYAEFTAGDSWGGVDDTFQAPTGANGYRADRNALWDWIDSHGIRGVVFLAGDQHWAAAFKATYGTVNGSRSRYEFMSSPFNQTNLTKNPRTPDATNGPVFWAYDAAVNAGLVTVDTTVEPPTVSFQLYGTGGSLGGGNLTAIDGNKIDAGLPIHRASLLGCGA